MVHFCGSRDLPPLKKRLMKENFVWQKWPVAIIHKFSCNPPLNFDTFLLVPGEKAFENHSEVRS